MNAKDGVFRQRVGYLIEQHICKKYNLFYNKRQRTQGYYDAYNLDTIFEIKASSIKYNTFIIRIKNHEKLTECAGSYIFVTYAQKDSDKDLRIISDISIKNIYGIKANDIIIKNSKKLYWQKNPDKHYIKISLNDIKKLEYKVIT